MKGELRNIPGVGPNIEADLQALGIRKISDLIGRDPEALYAQDCARKGFAEDRCQLYVFRLAAYYAENEDRDPEKLKWWYWKDRPYPPEGAHRSAK